jgi:hypothetical protein
MTGIAPRAPPGPFPPPEGPFYGTPAVPGPERAGVSPGLRRRVGHGWAGGGRPPPPPPPPPVGPAGGCGRGERATAKLGPRPTVGAPHARPHGGRRRPGRSGGGGSKGAQSCSRPGGRARRAGATPARPDEAPGRPRRLRLGRRGGRPLAPRGQDGVPARGRASLVRAPRQRRCGRSALLLPLPGRCPRPVTGARAAGARAARRPSPPGAARTARPSPAPPASHPPHYSDTTDLI